MRKVSTVNDIMETEVTLTAVSSVLTLNQSLKQVGFMTSQLLKASHGQACSSHKCDVET